MNGRHYTAFKWLLNIEILRNLLFKNKTIVKKYLCCMYVMDVYSASMFHYTYIMQSCIYLSFNFVCLGNERKNHPTTTIVVYHAILYFIKMRNAKGFSFIIISSPRKQQLYGIRVIFPNCFYKYWKSIFLTNSLYLSTNLYFLIWFCCMRNSTKLFVQITWK